MSGGARTVLEGELTIFSAAGVKETLLAALQGGDAVEVDLSRVAEIDSAGVQLLVAAKRFAGEAGKTLTLTGHSPAVVGVFDLCDLSGHFGDPMLLPRKEAA